MAAQPPIPDNVLAATTNLADAFSSTTSRQPLDFLRPLMGVVQVMWEEVQRQQVLNVEHPLVTETGAVAVGKRSTSLIEELYKLCRNTQRKEPCPIHPSFHCGCGGKRLLSCKRCTACRAAIQLEHL